MAHEKLPGIRQFDLSGKTAVVTGGSKGLGYAMAAGLASAGANIVIVNRNSDEGKIAADSLIRDYAVNAKSFAADIGDVSQSVAMAAFAEKEFGSIDILINSAGINIRGPIDIVSPEDFAKVMHVNVTGTWLASRAVTPVMKRQRSGKIINLASALGLIGLADRTPYTSSKGAVVQMTRALAIELAPFSINVNAMCPGPFLTEMNIPIADNEQGRAIVGATAFNRWGKLEEIQGAAIFLASPASNYVTGAILAVDGGWTAR